MIKMKNEAATLLNLLPQLLLLPSAAMLGDEHDVCAILFAMPESLGNVNDVSN